MTYTRTVYLAVFLPALCLAQAPPKFTITTLAGNTGAGFADGTGSAAQFSSPCQLAVDSAGNVYVADPGNSRIRKITPDGTVSTIAGNGTAGYAGDGKPPTQANISQPCGVAVNSGGDIFFSQGDNLDSAVRKAPASGTMSTVAGTPLGAGYSGDGQMATTAQVANPSGLALDSAGNLYIADSGNQRIRMISSKGIMSTIAGTGFPDRGGDGGPATSAQLNNPQGVAVDTAGNVYIADTNNHRVRKIATDGTISTVAGIGLAATTFSGDGGPATKAALYYPKDVAVDAANNLYIVDSFNNRIRVVTPDGTINTVAGSARSGSAGDGGSATSAQLRFPLGIAVGPKGTLYISDTQNNEIRVLTPAAVANPPSIDHAQSVTSCGAFTSAAPGAWIEIYGSNLATNARQWASSDFNGVNAPTSLDGTQVAIAGQNAVLSYIGPGQVNAQVPPGTGTGPQQITVSVQNVASAPYTMTMNAAQPGLCQGLQIGGKQYVAAVLNNTTTYILPAGANAGVDFRPVKPGETINLFGNGFGTVTPVPTPGQLVQQTNQLTAPLQIMFGDTPATVVYWGLAPGAIGLYQFNVVAPNVADSDAVPVTFTLGGVAGTQTLYTAVHQ